MFKNIKMNLLLLTLLAITINLLPKSDAKPTDVSDAVVEIVKQKLVKFPEDIDQQPPPPLQDDDPKQIEDKDDEAKRILREIEKINQALGYVKKQPESSKLPPILDSSQYLFPQPAYHPFHSQHHQTSGSNGETLLIPSIRAVRLDDSFANQSTGQYNVPPNKRKSPSSQKVSKPNPKRNTLQLIDASGYQEYLARSEADKKRKQQSTQFNYRPNRVEIPAPQDSVEKQQLPTHFVIPVRLYKLNKEEYRQRNAPEEYNFKSYKIVGDIDNFYGKAKSKNKTSGHKNKSSAPKYHLFFMPHDLTLNENATYRHKTVENSTEIENASKQQEANSREDKLTNRPYKVQTTASNFSSQNLGGFNTNVSTTAHIIRKKVIPKPLRKKETSHTVSTTAASTVQITPPPPPAHQQSSFGLGANMYGTGGIMSTDTNTNTNNNFNMFTLRPFSGTISSTDNNNTSTDMKNGLASNVIKNAFQNIFRFPFRPGMKPAEVQHAETTNNLEVMQVPTKTFFTSGAPVLPQPLYQGNGDDSKSDDDDNSNSAAEETDDSQEKEEKHIFGLNKHKHHSKGAQKEAIKQGGIVIQRLKVRRGGIAIAGPGGVATAGSGGTAIVGPGGYALTHPRSLTIAGPGAKVIAIPSSVDLKDALERTNLHTKSFPREGKIVATGPTVYYSPATGSSAEV